MDLKATLQSDLKDAMRNGQETRKSTIRMALTAIKLAEVEKIGQLNEAEIHGDHTKRDQISSRGDADAERANDLILIPQAEEEIKVLQDLSTAIIIPEELELMAKAAILKLELIHK